MKLQPFSISVLLASAIGLLAGGISFADDSTMFRKNVSGTPDLETEHAAIRMLPLYVPPQSASGDLLDPIVYTDADGNVLEETREYVRPLITHYNDGHVEFIEEEGYGGFPGHGNRDAYGAVSLDDGASWKKTNLSKSGDSSSFKIKLGGKKKVAYPGDVGRSFAASDGNKVLIVWVSRYARGGNPNYAMTDDERAAVATYLGLDVAACTDGDLEGGLIDTPCLYLEDIFAVAGSQGSSDLADEDLPLIGELPYAAVWAARGVILPPAADDELSTFVWFKAERLSSAVRDANRPETACVKGAGCVVTWQEDPDGMRPGQGEGPGEGWSGAIAHHQTDTWYSYIDWDDFDLVADDTLNNNYGTLYDGTGDLATWVAATDSGSPSAAIPMAIPVRLTDNAMCVAEGDKPYCYADFDGSGTADFCASSVQVTMDTPEGPDQTVDMCITEDGRLLRGNTASTRARLGLHGYSTLGDYRVDPGAFPIDNGWFYMAYEENKGLGDCDDVDEIVKVDMGKNVWYHTFNMFHPELVSQGLMLNQPAVYPDDFANPGGFLTQDTSLGYNFYTIDPDPIYESQAGIDTTLYQAEIARRPSKISQDWYDAGPSGLVGLQLWKQGIVRRGGPADIMARRFVIPDSTGGGEECGFWNWCENSYDWCENSYNWCENSYDWCENSYNWCETEYDWLAYADNPAYKPNPGACKRDPLPDRCYPYIDDNGDLTEEEGRWTDITSCNLVVTCPIITDPVNQSCEFVAETCDTVVSCPDIIYPDDQSCDFVAETCDTVVSCPDIIYPDDQLCEFVAETCDTVVSCPDIIYPDDQSCDFVTETCGPVESCPAVIYPDDQSCTWVEEECPDSFVASTEDFDPSLDNPYDYANMECGTWAYTDGTNPRYVKGFCADPAINLSGNTILTSESCGDDAGCLEAFPFNEYFDDIDMTVEGAEISKILTWEMSGPGYGETITDTTLTNLDDLSWENPYDMAKGHRGFLAGDMAMVMYGWTENWKALTDAHDIINLYVRRSFDGGLTWSTLPVNFVHTNGEPYSGDGTTTCEWMGPVNEPFPVCVDYAAGDFEQARNVSQLLGSQVTVLDPRFAPTSRSITDASVNTASLPAGFFAPEYADDTRDPSRFFMVYETGQSSAYDAGEAIPLDLFYSQAIEWGDEYLVWQDEANDDCLPSADTEDEFDLAGFCNEFDAIEGSQFSESGEASVAASPGGQFFYPVWNQWDFDHDGYLTGADAWFRRILFLDDYIPGEAEEPTP